MFYNQFLVSLFLELIPYLFKIKGVSSFLNEKLSQDPLEKFFSVQRQQGQSNEKPTVSWFLKNTQGLKVINSIWLKDITGNCRGCKRKSYNLESVDLSELNKPHKKEDNGYPSDFLLCSVYVNTYNITCVIMYTMLHMYSIIYDQVNKVLHSDLAFSVPFFVSCLYISIILFCKREASYC